jgi:hypothetical protein
MHYALELINSESSQRDFWVNLNLNHQIQTNRLLVWTSNLYPWIGLDTRWKLQQQQQQPSLLFPSKLGYARDETTWPKKNGTKQEQKRRRKTKGDKKPNKKKEEKTVKR